jgi:indolepyruvate ferredoxin oxidoreductase beta subunit
VVTSHLRFGEGALAADHGGHADLLVGFEAPRRCAGRTYLKPGGLALVNRRAWCRRWSTIGLYDYPDDPIGEMRAARPQGVRLRRHDHRDATWATSASATP